MASWYSRVEEFEEFEEIYEAGLEFPEEIASPDGESEDQDDLTEVLAEQFADEVDPRSRYFRPKPEVFPVDKLIHKKACIIGSHIFGSIKLGYQPEVQKNEVRLFINMDVPENYTVLSFSQASELLQGKYSLIYTESWSVFNTSYMLGFLMNLKNWQLFSGSLPKTVTRHLTALSLGFCLAIYNLKVSKKEYREEKLGEEKTKELEIKGSGIVLGSEEDKDEKFNVYQMSEEKLQKVLEIIQERFSIVGDLLSVRRELKHKTYVHRAKIFGRKFLLPYLEKNCLSQLRDLSTVQLNQLECLNASDITSLSDWNKVVQAVKNQEHVEPSSEIVSKILTTVTSLTSLRRGFLIEEEELRKVNKRPDIRKYRKIVKETIKNFFDGLGTVKAIGLSGLVYSMNSLPALINYCQKMANSKALSHDDIVTVIGCRDDLIKLADEGDTLPLATLQQQIKTLWDELIEHRTEEDCKAALLEIRNKFLESTVFEEAWSYALRMKGLIYEIMFAEDFGLNYVQEVNKMTLGTFIYKTYPAKYQDFLLRSSKNTYIRDLKPDFILYMHGSLTPVGMSKWSQKLKETISSDSMDPASAEDIPLLFTEEKYDVNRQKVKDAEKLIKKLLRAVKEKRGESGDMLLSSPGTTDEMERSSKPNLVIIEVGYHTNSSDKVSADINKWRPAKDVLCSLGFDFRVVSVADSTAGMNTCSWISKDKSKMLIKNIGATFGKLTANMPPGLTDVSLGQISTQKLRSRVSTDHIRKTPVTESDLDDFMNLWKDSIFIRPSGAIIPLEIQKQFCRTMITGSTMSKSSADKVLDLVKSNQELIIDKVRASSLRFDILDNNSWILFVYGSYEKDLESYCELNCSFLSKTSIEAINKSIEAMKYEVNKEEKIKKILLLKEEFKNFEQNIDKHCESAHTCKIQNVKKSWLLPVLMSLSKQGKIEYGIKSTPEKSSIDWLCSLTLAGRTGKQKETKAQTIRLAELISRCTSGFLKDSKGLLLAPYKEIMKKGGVKTTPIEGIADYKDIEKTLGINRKERRKRKSYLGPNSPAINLFKSVMYQFEKIMSKSDTLNTETIRCLKKLREDMIRVIREYIIEKKLETKQKTSVKDDESKDQRIESEGEYMLESLLDDTSASDIEPKKDLTILPMKETESNKEIEEETSEEHKEESIYNLSKSVPCPEEEKQKAEKVYKKDFKKNNDELIEEFELLKPKITCYELLNKIGMNSYVSGDNFNKALFTLLKDTVNTDPAALVFEGHDKKLKKFRELTDDRYAVCSTKSIASHLKQLMELVKINMNIEEDDEVFNAVLIKAVEERFSNFPIGQKIFEGIRWFCKLIMGTGFGKSLYYYMKLCECFLNFTSEMTYSGVKVMKLKNCNLNLLCKVNKNKNTNCLCLVLDNEFNPISEVFYLNRNRATLGQSFLYCMILNIYQAVQTQNGYEFIENQSVSTSLVTLETRMKDLGSEMIKTICAIGIRGMMEEVTRKEGYKCLLTGSSSVNAGFNTTAAMIVNYTLIFTISMLNNSRRISKLTQMVRYPLMLSISEFGFPKGVGSKMDCTIRSVEDYILKKYLIFVGAINIMNCQKIVNSWSEDEPNNAKEVVSLELFPFSCKNPRQMVSDKYICHFYNKEDDDFAEASIRVLNEVCDKIFDWEDELKKECDLYYEILNKLKDVKKSKIQKETKENSKGTKIKKKSDKAIQLQNDLKKCSCRIRSLLGVKDVDIDKKSKIGKSWLVGSATDSEDSESTKSGSSKSGSVYSLERQIYLEEDDTISATGSTHLSERIPSSSKMDKINSASILYQIKKTCENMYKFTFGVPEITQAFAEKAKSQYSSFNILNALKSKRNNEQISKITETTSIVSEPNPSFNIENAINTMSMKNAIKLVKIITKSNRATMSTSLKYRSFEREMSRILLMEDQKRDESMKDFKDNIEELRKKSRIDWKSICCMKLEEVIMTDNCSHLFVFIKSFWKKIKNLSGRDRKGLVKESDELLKKLSESIAMNAVTHEVDSQFQDLREELDELRKMSLNEFGVMFRIKQSIDGSKFSSMMNSLIMDFIKVNGYFDSLDKKRRDFPGAAYPEDERELMNLEEKIHEEHHICLLYICLSLIVSESVNPFTFSTNTYSTEFLKEFKKYALGLIEREVTDENQQMITDIYLGHLLLYMNNSEKLMDWIRNSHELTDFNLERIVNYCQLLMLNIRRPISMRLMDVSKGLTNITDIMETLKAMLSKSSYKETQFDFSITIVSCVKGSLQMCRKLLDRREKMVKLPRGTRSKVIYEMIKATKVYNTTSVQEIGFQCALDVHNRFYAGVAPKAQIGGDRDLLVMSTSMKIATHCTESCSKAIMECSVDNDGLTNKYLKDQILEKGKENILAKQTTDRIIVKSEKKNFVRVFNISGDCGKWGPVHCKSYFSSTMQQLLSDFPDWSCMYRLIMLKSLNKQLEIPTAALEKIVQSALMNGEFRKGLRKLKIEGNKKEKYKIFKETIDKEWGINEKVKKIVNWYLKDDKAYIDSYNHMGQGIHHATSSLFGNVCQRVIDDILELYLESKFPECSIKITHAGSSDDFAKTVIISGSVTEETYKYYDSIYKEVICDTLNLMTGIMRCCQMLVSEKTVVSPIVLEFYSEFLYVNKVSPSTKKYLTSQLINHSVTSPITLNQATHVECQQAMYMGVPLASIVMLSLLKQNLFVENSIDIYRRYGGILFNSVSTLGRLYLPKYSRLTTESASLEDLEVLRDSIIFILTHGSEIGISKKLSRKRMRQESMSYQEKVAMMFDSDKSELEIEEEGSEIESAASSDQIIQLEEQSSGSSEGLKKLHSSEEDDDTGSESSEKKATLEDDLVISCFLNLIMFKYYSNCDDYQTDEGFEKLQNWSSSTLLKDPFAQMLPESIRVRIEQLKSIKNDMQDLKDIVNKSGDPFKIIALNIIAKNTVTEDYDFEVGRLQQALESANIIWGLAGGIRSISVSINRQMLRSYHFENKLPISISETWVAKDNSKFISGAGEDVKPSNRVRLSGFLDKIKESIIITGNLDMEVLSVVDIPIEVHEIDGIINIIVDPIRLEVLQSLVTKVIEDLKDSNQINLESLETCTIDEFERVHRPTIRRTRLVKAEKLSVFKNNPAVIAAAIIHQDSLYECRPTNMNYSFISSDIASLETNFPNVIDMINQIKINQKIALKKTQEELTKITRENVAKLISCCRMLNKQKARYQKLFILTDLDEEASTTECKVLFSYNSIENMRIVTSITSTHRIQDEITYTLLGVINCINWYFKTDDDKNSMLLKFLKTNVYRLIDFQKDKNCEFSRRSLLFLDQLPNTSVETFFSAECKYARKLEKQKTLNCLSKICSNPSELHRASENYGYKTEIDYRGDIESGMFSFSSLEGTATGYVRNQTIFLMLSNTNPELLYSLENVLLNRFNMKAGEIEMYKAREQFFRLLPKYRNFDKNLKDNHFIYLDKDARFHIVVNKEAKPRNCRSEPRICFISRGSLVTRYKEFITESRSIEQKWSNKYLYLISSVVSRDVLPADSAISLINTLNTHLGEDETEKIKSKLNDSVRRNIIHKINIQGSVSQHSVALFHCLLKHSKEMVRHIIKTDDMEKVSDEEIDGKIEFDSIELDEVLRKGCLPGSDEFYTEKIMPILNSVDGLETVWPINFLLDYYGYHHLTIDFEGVTENTASMRGGWNINKEQRFHINQLQKTIESILKLNDNHITKETIFMSYECRPSDKLSKLVKEFVKFYKDFAVNRDYFHICLYLLSVYLVRQLGETYKGALDKCAIFVKKFAESTPSLKFSCSKITTMYIEKITENKINDYTSSQESVTRIFICFELNLEEVSSLPGEDKKIIVRAIHQSIKSLRDLNLKLKRKPEVISAKSVVFKYTIQEITQTKFLFRVLGDVNDLSLRSHETDEIYCLFYHLIRMCVKEDSGLSPNNYPKDVAVWLLAGEAAYKKEKPASKEGLKTLQDLASSYLSEEESTEPDELSDSGSGVDTKSGADDSQDDVPDYDKPDFLASLCLEQYYE